MRAREGMRQAGNTQDKRISAPEGLGLPDLSRLEVLRAIDNGECPFCGNGPLHSVGRHLSKHGLRANDVRRLYGITKQHAFVSTEVSAKLSEGNNRRLLDPLYKEEITTRIIKAPQPSGGPRHGEAVDHIRESKRAHRFMSVCVACGSKFWSANGRRTCSPPCEQQARHDNAAHGLMKWKSEHPEQVIENARKMGKAQKGRKLGPKSASHKAALSASWTEERREALRERNRSHRHKPWTEERREALRERNRSRRKNRGEPGQELR